MSQKELIEKIKTYVNKCKDYASCLSPVSEYDAGYNQATIATCDQILDYIEEIEK